MKSTVTTRELLAFNKKLEKFRAQQKQIEKVIKAFKARLKADLA